VIRGNQGKGAKTPEYKGMGDAGKGPAANHLCLKHHVSHKTKDPFTQRMQIEIRVVFSLSDLIHDRRKAASKGPQRCDQKNQSDCFFKSGEKSMGAKRLRSEPCQK
jgi:hypothetical protein